jgi:hypothetical protein
MTVVTMTLRLDGQRPLLMNSSAKADPLNPIKIELDRLTSKRDKTVADHEQIAKAEWHAGLWLQDGKPCIPSEAIESTRPPAPGAKASRRKPGFVVSCRPCWSTKVPVIFPRCGRTRRLSFVHPSTSTAPR